MLSQGVQHRLTHRLLHIDFYECRLADASCTLEGQWMTACEVDSCALPRPLEEVWKKLRPCNFATSR